MRYLGIDPGLRVTGYACVERAGASRAVEDPRVDGFRLVEAGVLRLSPRAGVAERLAELDADLQEVIERVRPDAVGIEKLFSHYKHPATGVLMGHGRGVVLLRAVRAGVSIVELGATEVKKSLTGHGHASKRQIQDAVRVQLGLSEPPSPHDVADAMAIALCCARRSSAAWAEAGRVDSSRARGDRGRNGIARGSILR